MAISDRPAYAGDRNKPSQSTQPRTHRRGTPVGSRLACPRMLSSRRISRRIQARRITRRSASALAREEDPRGLRLHPVPELRMLFPRPSWTISLINVAIGSRTATVQLAGLGCFVSHRRVSRCLTSIAPQPLHKTSSGWRFPWSEGVDRIFRNEEVAGSNHASSTKRPGHAVDLGGWTTWLIALMNPGAIGSVVLHIYGGWQSALGELGAYRPAFIVGRLRA